MLRELVKGLLAVSDSRDPVIFALEIRGDRIADILLVLHEEDASCFIAHGSLLKLVSS